jgi:hypothetical protein
MTRLGYYSPLVLGAGLVLFMNEPLRSGLPKLTNGAQWGFVIAVAVAVALQCQVLLIGAQGAFAQVLPVPGGRSVRGSSAATAGWLLLAWVALTGVAALLATEGVRQAAYGVGIAALAALVGFFLIYIWNLPAAAADFVDERVR